MYHLKNQFKIIINIDLNQFIQVNSKLINYMILIIKSLINRKFKKVYSNFVYIMF